LQAEDVLAGFHAEAVPGSELPPSVRFYALQYKEMLRQTVQTTRHMRLYLVMDSAIGELGLIQMLGTYGVGATPLGAVGIPLPFVRGSLQWNRLTTPDSRVWSVVRSRLQQSGVLHPRMLHRLFALDFPVWASLDIHTYSQQKATRLLREKDTSARFEKSASGEAQAAANAVRGAIGQLRQELSRVGSALHQVRLSIVVGADDETTLAQRLEVVRGTVGMEMEPWESPAAEIGTMFGAEPPRAAEGSLLPSHGLAILTGSALSYRRRTETRGVYLGTDRNQAPVILNLFDDKNPHYNTVILGQSGSGKSFTTLLLMLRHLMLGVRLIIVDPQGNIDLSWLGEEVYHRSILGTSEAAINVLDIAHEEIANQVGMVLACLGMLGVVDPSDRLEVAILDQVLMDIYAPLWERGEREAVPTLHAVQHRLDDIAADEDAAPEIRSKASLLAFALEQYTVGSRAALFGRPTTVDLSLDHAVTVFDVSRLPKEEQGGNLRAALLSILVGDINQAIRRKRRAGDQVPMLVFIDEMGVLMRDSVIAAHVSEEYKTARSRRVGMIVADQDLPSLLGPADESGLHHGEPILANTANTLIFNQKAGELANVRERFPDLPEAMIQVLPVMRPGTCLVQLPDDLLQVSVRPSAFELAVLSSRLQDRARARAIIAQVTREVEEGLESVLP
ncbi:MAG: DUF87 domain-containing protein, partial [Ardenticatenales bacterium]|nr:DUF87 domain-containing protein [Ardenticatenales bacterium]